MPPPTDEAEPSPCVKWGPMMQCGALGPPYLAGTLRIQVKELREVDAEEVCHVILELGTLSYATGRRSAASQINEIFFFPITREQVKADEQLTVIPLSPKPVHGPCVACIARQVGNILVGSATTATQQQQQQQQQQQ